MFNQQAQEVSKADVLIDKIISNIVNPAIAILFAFAFLLFLYGVFEFIKDSADLNARTQGKNHMIWGIVGMFIMIAAFGIMGIIAGTLGVDLNTWF